MASNYVMSGKRLHLTASAALAGGTLARQVGYVGVPIADAPSGATVAFALEGVWGMTYAAFAGLLATISVGTILYWDTTAGALSIGSANDDYAAVKVVKTGTLTTDGAFQGLLLPQGRPVGQDQS